MNELNDTYYIQRTLDGDIDYFSRLVDRYSDRIYALVFKIVRRKEDAEELTQDVFLKTFRQLQTFKGECRFSTWLYRIAYTTAISATRKKRPEFLYLEDRTINNVKDDELEAALNDTDNSEKLEKLGKAVELLPPEERGLITLYYMEAHPIEEIATVTGMTQTNVKVKLHRIRKKLYLIMEEL